SVTIRLRLTDIDFSGVAQAAFESLDKLFAIRKNEADEFYHTVVPQNLSPDAQNVMRQSFAGMLWSKQFYHYELKRWLEGDPGDSEAAGGTIGRAQQGMATPLQRGCDLHARQVGISLVCRVGPGFSLRTAGTSRLRVCEGPARAFAARMVHAPERAIAGL